ncbi:MAG: LLM class flavin-dependent oxidoreductase [Alphaproteobacteria bacterium]|nr:LLM class flavin-dependent oxidoreductase [Alphaproteobacteria bacterium]
MSRQMSLGLFPLGHGHNVGSWRAAAARKDDLLGLDYYVNLARLCERGTFDMIFFAEILYSYEQNGRHCGQLAYPTLDPVVLISAIAHATENLGLVATYSTTYTDADATAAKFATIDRLTGGRAGWNIVTTGADQSAHNFSQREHPEREARYTRAQDYVDRARALWREWPSSAQKRPVLVQAGMSPYGRAFAATVAEVMFTVSRTIEDGRKFRVDIRALIAEKGRDPDQVKVLPGIAPIIASTEAEAKRKEDEFFDLVHPRIQLALLADQFGMDFTGYALDQPLPIDDIMKAPHVVSGARDPSRLIQKIDGQMPTLGAYLRQSSRVRSHQSFVGTPEQFADHMQRWFETGACDGFNILPPVIPGEFETVIDHVVPILRKRGLFRSAYPGKTLRDTLGLTPLAAA